MVWIIYSIYEKSNKNIKVLGINLLKDVENIFV